MEGPSLFLAQEQLQPFKGKRILQVTGNTKIGKERLQDQIVKEVFSWAKHLVFQFDDFALRVHFMLFGTFEATIEGKAVTGDYKRAYEPRLALSFENGEIQLFNCSIKFIESKKAQSEYDYSIDIMSPKWDSNKALRQVKQYPDEQIADVLLDQEIFAGVGNMIKNEVLSLTHLNPKRKAKDIPDQKLRELISVTKSFSIQFYEWRKEFILTVNLKVHRKANCPFCDHKLIREKTGKKARWSYYCPICQTLT